MLRLVSASIGVLLMTELYNQFGILGWALVHYTIGKIW